MAKLMIDIDKSTVSAVQEKTGVLQGLTTASRLLLGTAIGAGVVVSGLAFALVKFPAEEGGGASGNTPLKLAYVSSGEVTVEGQKFFQPFSVYAGPKKIGQQNDKTTYQQLNSSRSDQNVALKVGTTTAQRKSIWSWLQPPAAFAQATPFSIEPINGNSNDNTNTPVTGFPGQMIVLQYFDASTVLTNNLTQPKTITICLGKTSATTVYVGSDGSTYTNSKLTSRTTSQPCPTTLRKALQLNDLTNIAASPSSWQYGSLYLYQQDVLGGVSSISPDYPSFFDGESFEHPIGPLATVVARNSGDSLTGFMMPKLTVTVTGTQQDQQVTKTLCYPKTNIPAPGPNFAQNIFYYYDTNGNVYSDIFLTQRVSCTSGGSSGSPQVIPVE